MKYLRKACAVFMTGLFCWLPVLQPVSLYAETVVYDAQATGADNGTTEEDATAVDVAADDASSAADEQSAPDESAGGAEAADQQLDADDQADQNADQQEATQEPQDQGVSTLSLEDEPASASESADASGSVGPTEDAPNSWRYDNGTLRTDVDPGISLFSMDALPEDATAQGIDVSQWNGTIDWAKVKAAGIDFAILRVGYGDTAVDTQFANNVRGCKANGIPFGVYVYCYAWDAASARSEANGTVTRLRNAGVSASDLSLPVYYDMENERRGTTIPSGVDGNNQYHDIQGGPATFASMASAFASVLQGAGYDVGVYANLNWWNNYLTDSVFGQWDRWVAQYNTSCSYKGEKSAWQYTSTGSVPGISTAVDMNWWYTDRFWESKVRYRSHVADYGWQNRVADGETSGTVGKGKSIEAITLHLGDLGYSGRIEARGHFAGTGWEKTWASADEIEIGVTGQSRQMEAIEIRLSGEAANHYDVYYRVHCAEVGWLGWAKNGEAAGTQGYGHGMQAIEVRIVAKAKPEDAPTSDKAPFMRNKLTVSYQAHVSDIGWQGYVRDGAISGTVGQAKGIEALNIGLDNMLPEEDGSIGVRAHLQNVGWQPSNSDDWISGQQIGKTGIRQHIEAIQIKLLGSLASKYDIYYRVHAANIGWMAWAKNGEQAGTQGYGYAMEAIQIVLVEKGKDPQDLKPDSVTSDAFRRKPVNVSYQAHVATIGWQGSVEGGKTAGTVGKSLAIEALRVNLTNSVLSGEVKVNAHVADIGWQKDQGKIESWGSEAGTTGRSKAIQAIQVQLTDEMANAYDIYYRVHSSNYGWLDWAKNGAIAGTTGLNCPIEAIEIKLVTKGGEAPGSTNRPYISAPTLSYLAHSASIGWGKPVTSGVVGTTGRSLRLEAFSITYKSNSVSGGISYRAHVADVGWQKPVSNGATAGTVGKSKQVEAIQISLTGNAANLYDIWYRVYIQDFGWLGWAKNGATAGTTSCGLRVEAFEIAVRAKGAAAPGSTSGSSYSSKASLPYIGYQNPSWCYQVSNKSVNIKNLGSGIFGYRTESRIPYNATRNQIVNTYVTRAMEYLGTRYIWDYACAPGVGVDCAGLVLQSLYAVGMDLSPMNPWDHYHTPGHDHYANDMRASSRFQKVSFANRQVGDLILTAGHVSIYIGGNRIIEAYPGAGVRTNSVYSSTPILAVARPVV